MPFRSKTLCMLAGSALLITACGDGGGGGSDKVSANDYAASVCTAFGDWRDAIQKQRDDLQSGLQPGISPEEGKSKLEDFLGQVVDATDQLVSDVDDAGVPDAENGDKVADALKGVADQAQSKLEDAQQKVSDLPTDSRQAFGAAASTFGNDVQTALSSVGSGLSNINSKDLEKAFQDESACQS